MMMMMSDDDYYDEERRREDQPVTVTKSRGILLGFGHPLLDISANVTYDFIKKYNLQEDNVILGSEEHKDLVDELINNFDVKFTPGGATQNSIRVAQWILREAGSTAFIGSIGDDDFGQVMKQELAKEGVDGHYAVIKGKPTGTCAVLITNRGLNRSLVSFPGAARSHNVHDIPWDVVNSAKILYTAGFTLNSGFDFVLELLLHHHHQHHGAAKQQQQQQQEGKIFCLNLSASYVALTQASRIQQLLPLTDILFGNESEVKAFAHAMNWVSVTVVVRETIGW